MVNPVGKYKFWDSTTMNGLGTTANDFWPALEAELDSWITAISGNSGITGAVPVKRKGVADSTNANNLGVVVELPHPTAGTIYAGSYCTSATSRFQIHSSTWSDSGSAGGYGTFSGTSDIESSTWAATGVDAGIFLAYDTTDTQEFFVAGYWDANSSSNHDPIICMVRGTTGHWASHLVDTTTNHILWYAEHNSAYKSSSVPRGNGEVGIFRSLTNALPYGIGDGAQFISANPRLLTTAGLADTGSYFGDAPYSAYVTSYYGPLVVLGN